jgi:homoserine kinase
VNTSIVGNKESFLITKVLEEKFSYMSSGNQKDTLIATAIAAAAAGAAVAYAAIKATDKKKSDAAYMPKVSRPGSMIFDQSDPRMQGDIIFPHNHEEKMRRRIAQRVSVEEENRTPRKSVTVRVPATSANVGPGCE